MNQQQQAISTLINAVRIATKRGAFELEETKVLLEAIAVFQPKDTDTSKTTETAPGQEITDQSKETPKKK